MIAGSIDPNCCWGGKDNVDACNRQGACNVGPDSDNYCAKFGITPQQCVSSLPLISWTFESIANILSNYRMLIVAIHGRGGESHALKVGMLAIGRLVAPTGFKVDVLYTDTLSIES